MLTTFPKWKERAELENEFHSKHSGLEVPTGHIKLKLLADTCISLETRKEGCALGTKL